MSAVTRIGDMNTGHDACPPTALSSGSANVFINGISCGRITDSYIPHSCIDHPSHVGFVASGSSSVFVNGLAVARIGDSVSCGGSVAAGSPNVFAGG
ncbi:PAAR domain-containing protein [Veillonella caviae]|uniref:PAAR domain-containing protein n=1 Tax=Veillonella caviae TaxID=248316 RepID=UPI002A918635|nr:PAAR domain-containing protein [Veillonella caviae]MDY5787000.1 PAAR domain-containing protein [Veillonella caviae]